MIFQWSKAQEKTLCETIVQRLLFKYGQTILIISPNKKSQDRLRDMVETQYRATGFNDITGLLRGEIRFTNDSRVLFRIAAGISLGCGLACSLVVFNEAEKIKEKLLNELLICMAPVSSEIVICLNSPEG